MPKPTAASSSPISKAGWDASRYTADTLSALRRRFPRLRFVWLMGGDNLVQIREWGRWPEIFRTVPDCRVRPPFLFSEGALRSGCEAVCPTSCCGFGGRRLAEMAPPAWAFFHTRLDDRSATRIRSERNQTPSNRLAEQKPELSTIAALLPRTKPIEPAPDDPRSHRTDLEDGKAEEIVTIDLAGKTTIADHMVIASGRSTRQVAALTEHLEEVLSRRTRISIEGKAQGDWVLIDAGDVIVHLFRPEIRSYYNLEKMWGGALPDGEAAAAVTGRASDPSSPSRHRQAAQRPIQGPAGALCRQDRAAAGDRRARGAALPSARTTEGARGRIDPRRTAGASPVHRARRAGAPVVEPRVGRTNRRLA